MTTIDKHPGDPEGEAPAYEEGWTAYQQDLDRTDNPYDPEREEASFEDWLRGWMDAMEEAEDVEFSCSCRGRRSRCSRQSRAWW